MNTKRARSADGAAARRNSTTENREPARETTPPMPAFDRSEPQRWLDALDTWFGQTKIEDSWIKYSIVATTQLPAEYAILNSDVQGFPRLDPYVLARRHILRQNRRERSPVRNSPAASDNESLIIIETGASTSPTPDDRVTTQSLHQLQEMLMAEIRSIRYDIEEIRVLLPSDRRTRRPTARPSTNATAAVNRPARTNTGVANAEPEICWYHTSYGRDARLCRAPCRYRA